MPKNHELVAIDPVDHNKRIVFDSKLEVFYLQDKILFVWKNVSQTLDIAVMRQWRSNRDLVWANERWRH